MTDCIIGLIRDGDSVYLATLEELKEHIDMRREFNAECDKYGMDYIKYHEYTLKNYADKRWSTNLTRFEYCPECGAKIDWSAIRRIDND